MELFELADFKFSLINLIDILLVVLLSFQLFKLLKGSLAFNILIGILTIYVFWLLVSYFEMPLLAGILSEFTKVGILAVLIVFQQEIRKFLLIIGNSSFLGENKSWWNIFPWKWKIAETFETPFEDILDACEELAESKTGAIIVFPRTSEMKFIGTSGELLDAKITRRLLVAIFNKTSPLHDGAVIVAKGRLKAANCVLPLSENPMIQNKYGLRHLSAVGITEQSDALVIVISEERGTISFAEEGKIVEGLTRAELLNKLNRYFGSEMLGLKA
ncbi:MAG: diadenylate cyclase CdaA [Bacteroidetes bacterium]|nr:diadenylate cyclase CdaA [Bacteroidota bacterium]MCK6609396.1 diadenylate cyclase CdaA [Bacteroidia bacterium]